MAANKDLFQTVTNLVIDKLEGGYYHPDMLADGRIKDQRYKNSGETMFGIDRKAGGSLNTTPAGKQFWAIIDKAGARKNWKWNYKGGPYAPALKDLADDIIYPQYEKLSKAYLSPKSKQIVDSDPRLLFHFIYGTWNGSGWFKKFATDINKQVDTGITNPDRLVDTALNSRTKEGLRAGSKPNSLVAQGGNKIAGFIHDLKNLAGEAAKKTSETIEEIKKKPTETIIIAGLLTLSIYALVTTIKKLK